VVVHSDHRRLDGRAGQCWGQHLLGGGVRNHADPLTGKVLDRGDAALEIDDALDELGDAIARRHDHPDDLEGREPQRLSDGRDDLHAKIDGVAGRLTIAAHEGERA
jgi:hypothetical protein